MDTSNALTISLNGENEVEEESGIVPNAPKNTTLQREILKTAYNLGTAF